MRVTRVLAAAALAAGALLVAPSQAAAPERLRGTTIITAERTSVADVVLYEDAMVRVNEDGSTPDITLTGKGRILRFDLSGPGGSLGALRIRRSGRDVTTTSTSGSYYPESEPCVPPGTPGTWACTPSVPPERVMIHQGHYRLRVLTDGSPVTITLRLGGVPGKGHLRVTKPLAGGVIAVPLLNSVAEGYQRFERKLSFTQQVEAILNVDAQWTPESRVTGVIWCRYDPAQQGLPSDYASYCPAGQSIGMSFPFVATTSTAFDPNTMWGLQNSWFEKGTSRVGFSIVSEQKVTIRTALVAWMAH